MLSKSKLFGVNLCLRAPTGLNMNGMYDFFCNSSFCTMTVSPEVAHVPIDTAESPELPVWVKISEKEGPVMRNPDEDFVLPSISYWVENHNLNEVKGDVGRVVSDTADTDDVKIGNILKKRFESPNSVVEALNGCTVMVTDRLVAQMLRRFRSHWIPAYGFFQWATLQMGLRCLPDTYNLLVDSMGKSKKFDLMWKVVEEMSCMEGGGYVSLVTMAKVMRRLAKAGRYEVAIDAFRRIEQFGVQKDVAALNTVLDALVKERSVEHAQDIYLEFKNDISPSMHTFNILIHGWSKARQIEKARSTMDEMVIHGFTPDVVSYTSLVEAHCCEKDFRKVHDVLEEMKEKGCPPNVVTYTIVMHAFGKAKEIDEALKVYEKMKDSSCVPDTAFYSSLIYILTKGGRLKDARELFDDMPRQGMNPDVLAYNTMIAGACEHSQEENALKLLQQMEQSHVKPDPDTYMPLLKMCCRLKRLKVLSFLLSHMLKNDISVELGTYHLLVRGLCKSGKLEHACSFFEDAVLRGFVPWDTAYKMLTTELEKKGMNKEKNHIEGLVLHAKQMESSNQDKAINPL